MKTFLLAFFTITLVLIPTDTDATPSYEDMVEQYVNFGAVAKSPDRYDCKKWVALFTENGTASAPGAPPASGSKELFGDCEGTRGLFNQLYAFQTRILPVGTSRLAFEWNIVGVLNSTGASVHVPAITTWEMDSSGGKIQHAKDFFDPTPLRL